MSYATDEARKVKKIDIKKTEALDWDFTLESESDKGEGIITYTDNFDNGDWLLRAPVMGSQHPQYSPLRLNRVHGKRIEGGQCKVTLTYSITSGEITYPGRPASPVKRYSLERALSEEPILTHPKFQELDAEVMDLLGGILAGERTRQALKEAHAQLVQMTGYSEAAEKAFQLIKRGTEAYLAPTFTWKEKKTSKDLTDSDSGMVGKIMTPPGSPPTPEGRNWLYMGLSGDQTENAESYEMERSWQLSDEGGWDEFLYGAEGGGE